MSAEQLRLGVELVLAAEPLRVDYWDGWACTDCVMLLANGETPPELAEDETAWWLSEIERRSDGGWWVVGDDCEEFSWSSCDVCGCDLGGARHAVTFFTS